MKLTLCALALVPVGVCSAQTIGAKHSTAGGFSSQISVWPSSDTKRLPANTDLMPTYGWRHDYSGASSALSTNVTSTLGHVRMHLKLVADASVSRGASVSVGGDTLLTLSSSTSLEAVLQVTVDATQTGPPLVATGSATVNVPGQGVVSVSASGRASRSFRVLIDSKGLQLASQASWFIVATFGSGVHTIDIDVQPLNVTAVPYGNRCSPQGPSLSGQAQLGDQLDLFLASQAPNALAGRLVGSTRLSVLIPGTSCWLNTDSVVVLPFTTDAKGEHSTRWPIPPQVRFNVQDLIVQKIGAGVSILTTNGLEIARR